MIKNQLFFNYFYIFLLTSLSFRSKILSILLKEELGWLFKLNEKIRDVDAMAKKILQDKEEVEQL